MAAARLLGHLDDLHERLGQLRVQVGVAWVAIGWRLGGFWGLFCEAGVSWRLFGRVHPAIQAVGALSNLGLFGNSCYSASLILQQGLQPPHSPTC